ncbi:MAG TPA: hypothetical protein VKT49_05150 [Bryobacteraceae bacterium]|nr:hypothetical protein [Bryobacteraceae bacterium]
MSVWADIPAAALSGSSGALVSISIDVPARDLEDLLETLARLSFPVNPQIYHEAAMVYVFADGSQKTEAATLVEFPAYAGQLAEVREGLAGAGFNPSRVQVIDMLAAIHGEPLLEAAPPGVPYAGRFRQRFRAAPAVR